MPILVDQEWFYPIDWRVLSRVIRSDRAQGRCERCARPHSEWVTRDANGHWWMKLGSAGATAAGGYRAPCQSFAACRPVTMCSNYRMTKAVTDICADFADPRSQYGQGRVVGGFLATAKT